MLKKLTTASHLLTQYPHGHMIKIWAFGNQHVFTMVMASQGHMIAIYNFQAGFWPPKSMGEAGFV